MSINGGVPFLIKTDGGLTMTATANLVTMTSQNLKGAELAAPALTGKYQMNPIKNVVDDNAFYSNTAAG
jgi:hypothetical protein